MEKALTPDWDLQSGKLVKEFLDELNDSRPIVLYLFGTELMQLGQFKASPCWISRSRKEIVENTTIVIAANIDVLVNLIVNSEKSHLLAFIGKIEFYPSEQELKEALQNVVDAFRPDFPDEDRICNPTSNTCLVWRCLFGTDIDVQEEIVIPAITIREQIWSG